MAKAGKPTAPDAGPSVTFEEMTGQTLRRTPIDPATTLTVSDIVARLRWLTTDPTPTQLSDKIQNLTREGLLTPVDQLHGGPGRHRRYGPDAPYMAALLHNAAAMGLLTAYRPTFHHLLAKARDEFEKFRRAKAKGANPGPRWIEVYFKERGLTLMMPHDGTAQWAPDAKSSVRFNVTAIFERVWAEEQRLAADAHKAVGNALNALASSIAADLSSGASNQTEHVPAPPKRTRRKVQA